MITLSQAFGMVSERTRELNFKYFKANTDSFETIDINLIDDVQQELLTRRLEVAHNLRTYLREELELDEKEIEEEIEEEKVLITYDLVLEELQKLQKTLRENQKYGTEINEEEIHEKVRKIIELDYALKTSGIILPQNQLGGYVVEKFRKHKINKTVDADLEARNLYDPKKKRILTQTEIRKLIEEGFDLSKLDPPPSSPFWSKSDLGSGNIQKNFHKGKTKLYDDVDVWFPHLRAKFKKVKKSQTKSKFHVTANKNGKKYKYKLKFAEETHSEVTASTLSAALGFPHDISKFVKDFEIELPKKLSLKELKQEWNSYYSSYNFDDYVKDVYQEDENTIVVIKEALLELIPSELVRVGPWAYGHYDHKSLREIRGLYIFNTWVANNDIKEADNNKLVLKQDQDTGEYQLFQYQHDQGFTFGKLSFEKVEEFPWDAIKKTGPEYVKLNNTNFQINTGFEHVTYSDARWMVRKIAKLSKDQIREAVELGGWPDDVSVLLAEKLSCRRNQLVLAFDLGDEFEEHACNRQISTLNGVIDNGKLTTFEFKDYLKKYGGEFSDFMAPILESAQYYVARGLIELTSSFDTFVIDSRELGYDSSILGQVQVTMNREIEENLFKQDVDDNFIVQDRVRIKFSLGVGLVFRGKVSYYKDYRLIYTKRTRKEAVFNNNFIFNALLPFHKRKNKLPKGYVMIVEDGFEGEGELFLESVKIPISASISKGVGLLSRTIMHKKDEDYSVMRDFSHFHSWHAALYANLYILRIPVFQADKYNGNLFRSIYNFKIEEGKESNEKLAYEYFLKTGDLIPLSEVSTQETIETDYVTQRGFFDFFGFLRSDDRKRSDEILYKHDDQEENFYQLDIEQIREWEFFDNGETKNRRFHLLADLNEENPEIINDVDLRVRIDIFDMDTKMDELDGKYLPMLNKVALNKNFIPFSPRLHSTNDTWGNMKVSLELGYPRKALDRILAITEDEFYTLMENSSNMDADFWRSYERDGIPNHIIYLKGQIHSFLNGIKKANKKDNPKEKYKKLTETIKKTIWKSDGYFNTTILERINYLVGSKDYYIRGIITMPEFAEMRLPADVPLFNKRNPHLYKSHTYFQFDYHRMEEIWYNFHRPR
jgi:uncharacterized protein YeaC (DUF1315 family)